MLNEKIYHQEISLMKTKKLNVTQPTVGMKVDAGCDLITLFISQKSNQQHSVCGNTATTCQFKKKRKSERANPSVNRYSKATSTVVTLLR